MRDNWIVANLENAFSTWNDKMTEIWQLLTTSPQSFKGGAIWGVISGINGGLQAIGLGLLVLFFAMSIFKSTASFRDFQRPEYALKHFIRFCVAKVAITYAMDLMTAIYSICGGEVVISDHISVILSFQVENAFSRLATIQLSLKGNSPPPVLKRKNSHNRFYAAMTVLVLILNFTNQNNFCKPLKSFPL